ncbi:Ribophorin I-domain-containing protein [Parasitella parasitica]|nr:Ribophorin I-domain-containing protein [Parasitella parasitica]
MRVLVTALLFLGCVYSFNTSQLYREFDNDRILRVIDLTSSVVKEDIAIRANYLGASPTQVYHFVLTSVLHDDVSSLEAFLKHKTKDALKMEFAGFDQEQQLYVYKIHLLEPIDHNGQVKLGIKLTYTHQIRPLPAQIPQISKQHVTYSNNIFMLSPYHTTDIKTTFTLPTTNVVNFKGGEPHYRGEHTKNSIVYGPFNDLPPLFASACSIHYEYQSPMITITNLKRRVQVSHWGGKLSMLEDYAIRHDGARLDKEFSRLQYQMSSHVLHQTNVLTNLVFDLPVSATGAYFRDEVGNVSTSNFRSEKTKTVMEIAPRFPLFGGWGTTFYLGYDAPLEDFLRFVQGKYMLKLDFLNNVKEMTIDQVELMLVLPEGASDIEVIPPSTFEMDSIEHKIHYTYFDSTGRPAIVFSKKNVVSQHEQPILISYRYSTIKLLQKPIVASIAFFIMYLLNIVASKIPWKIGYEEKDIAVMKMHEHEPIVFIKKPASTQKRDSTLVSRESSPLAAFVDEDAIAANTRARKPHVNAVLLEGTSTKKKKSASKKSGKKLSAKKGD